MILSSILISFVILLVNGSPSWASCSSVTQKTFALNKNIYSWTTTWNLNNPSFWNLRKIVPHQRNSELSIKFSFSRPRLIVRQMEMFHGIDQWFSKCSLRPAMSASPGNLLGMQIPCSAPDSGGRSGVIAELLVQQALRMTQRDTESLKNIDYRLCVCSCW